MLRLVGSSVTQGNSLMMTWSFNKTFFKEDAKRIWRQPLWNSIWNLLIYFNFWKYTTFGRLNCQCGYWVSTFWGQNYFAYWLKFKEDAKRIWGQPLWNSIWNLLIYFSFWKYNTFGCQDCTKANLLQEGTIFLIHLFARAILLMKKLKIKETKATKYSAFKRM